MAKQRKPKDAYWEDLCFEAQQAAEKAIAFDGAARLPERGQALLLLELWRRSWKNEEVVVDRRGG